MTPDHTLLDQFTSQAARSALDELIRRHLDLVYASALRETRNPHLAEDVAQAVFLILSQKASTIQNGVALAGWLLVVTRRTAVHAMKKQARDRRYEHASAKPECAPIEDAPWDHIAPVLDAALTHLPQHDRAAIVLRILENRTLAQVGHELGITEDTAQKRVTRALFRLRKMLGRRGISAGTTVLTATLTAKAVQAAPAHLLTDTLSGTTSASATFLAKGTLHVIALAKAKLVTAAMAAMLATIGCILFLSQAYAQPSAAAVAISPPAVNSSPPIFRTDDRLAEPDALSGPSSVAKLVADSQGNVYALGAAQDRAGIDHVLIRQKHAGQSGWTTIFRSTDNKVSASTVDSKGNLYIGDDDWNISVRPVGQSHFTAATTDQPLQPVATFWTQIVGLPPGSTINSATKPAQTPVVQSLMDLAIDSQGNIYGVGSHNSHWIVRKKAPNSPDFAIIDDFVADDAALARLVSTKDIEWKPPFNTAEGITIVGGNGPSAGIYVVGFGLKYVGTTSDVGWDIYMSHWIVRKSIDAGASWSTVDDFTGEALRDPITRADSPWIHGEINRAYGICADRAGNVYVAGMAKVVIPPDDDASTGSAFSKGVQHWITRSSTTGSANSWDVDDDFSQSTIGSVVRPIAVCCDMTRNIFVVGSISIARDVGNSRRGIIRMKTGGSWRAVEDYQPTSPGAMFETAVVDSQGRLYVGGATIESESNEWLLRSNTPALNNMIPLNFQNAKGNLNP